MYVSPRPLYAIPYKYRGVKAMFQDTYEHLCYDDGTMMVFATTLSPDTPIDDLDALEAGYECLGDFEPKYVPTANEVMRALRGPEGPAGPKGAKGDPGGLRLPQDPYRP